MSFLAKAIGFLLLALATIGPARAETLELLMFERKGCVYCARWDREIGASYALTEEGKKAPLRKIDLDKGQPDLALDAPVRFSPTFVLMKDGREVGRITGYMNDAMFWGLFSKMVQRQSSPTM